MNMDANINKILANWIQHYIKKGHILWKKALRNELFSRMRLAKGRGTRKELFTLI